MNSSLFHRYYEQQLNLMDTNPALQQKVASRLVQRHKQRHPWMWLGATLVTTGAVVTGLVVNLKPQSVTADALLAQALNVPDLVAGETYTANFTQVYTEEGFAETTYQTATSDGRNLERLAYNADHQLIGAELVVPQSSERDWYDVYEYGTLRDFDQGAPTTEVQHRVVYNVDIRDDVSSDDPSTFANLPDAWTDGFGRKSVLELVAGSSLWRPYTSNDVRHSTFFIEPVVTETELNGTPAYQLAVQGEGYQLLGWITKEDGRLLQQQSSADFYTDTTYYEHPIISNGALPTTVSTWLTTLKLSNLDIVTVDSSDLSDDTVILDDSEVLNCGGAEAAPVELESLCAPAQE